MDNEKLVRLEEDCKHLSEKVKNVEKKVENIYELTMSVKEIANEVKAMREDMNKIDGRVKVIEEKPTKRVESIISQIIQLVIAGIVGFILAKFGIK